MMPTNKDFKRLVRGRMQKTGESYTTARSHLLNQTPSSRRRTARPEPTSVSPPIAAGPAPAEYPLIAGMSDKAVQKATGCTWGRWVKALDRVGAQTWPHREIASHIHSRYKVPEWWGQMVAVGYERIRGLRVRGQRRDGGYNVTKSKVFPVPLGALYRAFSDARQRARWLIGARPQMRAANRNKSLRLKWPDETTVAVGFYAKGRSKSQVQVQHERLADIATAKRMRAYWTERLAALAGMLAG